MVIVINLFWHSWHLPFLPFSRAQRPKFRLCFAVDFLSHFISVGFTVLISIIKYLNKIITMVSSSFVFWDYKKVNPSITPSVVFYFTNKIKTSFNSLWSFTWSALPLPPTSISCHNTVLSTNQPHELPNILVIRSNIIFSERFFLIPLFKLSHLWKLLRHYHIIF